VVVVFSCYLNVCQTCLLPNQVVLPDESVNLDILAVDICNNSAILPYRLVVFIDHLVCVLSVLDWLGNGCVRFV